MADLPLNMPKMSMTMEEGTMVAWLKNEGDPVKEGEPIAEVATDKVDMEVESPYTGTLARIIAQPDDVIAVGEPIGFIATDADDLLGDLFGAPAGSGDAGLAEDVDVAVPGDGPAEIAAPPAEPAVAEVGDAGQAEVQDAAPVAASGWPKAVPAARALAAEQGVDLARVQGTGTWGAVRVADVEAAAKAAAVAAAALPAAAQSAEGGVPAQSGDLASIASQLLAATRSLVQAVGGTDVAPAAPAAATAPTAPVAPGALPPAADQAEAKRRRGRLQLAKSMNASALMPQFTAWVDLDLEALNTIRKTTLGGASWTAILLKAQAQAIAATPAVNATWVEGGALPNEHIGIALAVDAPNGLIAPVVSNPHTLTLAQVGEQIAALVEKAREGALGADDITGGTSVFSNLGGFGVRQFNALLTPPQATALSIGSIERRIVVAKDGTFGPRLTCTVGLTLDHRVADGADAARTLQALQAALADPAALLG